MTEFLTTKELAALLRIKERKVYDLASSGRIPCSRATGKLLFPRQAIEDWIARNESGGGAPRTQDRPNVVLGSHDPLLDWALRESGCGLATYFDGSLAGLDRFARGEGVAAGLHVQDPETDGWNEPIVSARFPSEPAVLIEWAWRDRGPFDAPDQDGRIAGLGDLKGRRTVPRQAEAGRQRLFDRLLQEAGLSAADLIETPPARTESDAALAVMEGKADAAFGLRALAAQYRLGFVPIIRERYDLLVDRRAWFEPPWQGFLAFLRADAFAARLSELQGYDASDLGRVRLNCG